MQRSLLVVVAFSLASGKSYLVDNFYDCNKCLKEWSTRYCFQEFATSNNYENTEKSIGLCCDGGGVF